MLMRIQDDCEENLTLTELQTCQDYNDFKLDLHNGFSNDSFYESTQIQSISFQKLTLQITDFLQQNISFQNPDINFKSLFHSKKVPKISIEQYIQRIIKYGQLQKETFYIAKIYLQRFLKFNIQFSLDMNSVHRTFFVAIVLASKYNEDSRLQNKDFAKIGGISAKELFMLEIEFLKALKFELKISTQQFAKALQGQVNQAKLC